MPSERISIYWVYWVKFSLCKVSHLDVKKATAVNFRRAFNNYVDTLMLFFDHLPTSSWTFFTLNVDKDRYFCATYQLYLFHVVIECPLAYIKHHLTRQAVTLRYKLSTMCLEGTETNSIAVMEIQPKNTKKNSYHY